MESRLFHQIPDRVRKGDHSATPIANHVRNPFFRIGLRLGWLVPLLDCSRRQRQAGRGSDPLRVQVDVGPGPYFVGQGFELRVGVVAAGQRPKIDPPRIDGAVAWTIDTDSRPISATGIGSMVATENLFVTRFRVVARRSGTLEIPAIQAQVRNRSGRSRPRRLPIQPVPLQGRPADFLGGVGRFELQAEAIPKVVRVGQELDFRIKVTGPAAWGMTDRPDLERFERLPLGLRIDPKPDRDDQRAAGADVRIPPSADARPARPSCRRSRSRRSILHSHATSPTSTAGVPIRVVAVPAFDPATIDDPESSVGSGRFGTQWHGPRGVSRRCLLLAASVSLAHGSPPPAPASAGFSGPAGARRYAARWPGAWNRIRTRPDRLDRNQPFGRC